MEAVKRIIVVDLLYLGDLLFAHPFLSGLRKLFPAARIDLVANSNFAELMRINPNLDHVYSYNKTWNTGRSYKFAKKLKMNNYQLGLNIHGNWRTALLLKVIAANYNIGYGGQGRGIFLEQEVNQTIDGHMIDSYLDFLNKLTQNEQLADHFSDEQVYSSSQITDIPQLEISAEYLQSGIAKLKMIGLNQEQKFIALNTGGSWPTKRWPVEHFTELAAWLIENSWPVLFIGGPGDQERVAQILAQLPDSEYLFNLTGQTSLVELTAVLKQAELIVSGDTGPVHVAAAVGIPTVTLFGPSDEKKYAPRGRADNIVIKNTGLNCRPCGEHECPLGHFKCLRELTSELVIDSLKARGLI
ncbi:lipopolysaccharide heptosyltransferase II [Halanaerobium salsuginis]|uniref:lipopolysaccharide heptosyltransferase II n=1 Tax=Halanaerobium salsuginis TaxID=29563 RepID=A0A1I4GWT5_9FIRM|nr:lipopolysaccharide heptosyltransferase II [Halanaerobium salsuginis]SFL33817.1 heptosyltransferase-2 [Halanaerobium salsuginis]